VKAYTNDERAVLRVLIDQEPGYVFWGILAEEAGLSEAAVHRAALGLIGKGVVACVTGEDAGYLGYERSEAQRALDGAPFPGRPGFVTARCAHAMAESEWRSGFRICEHC
jgi:hypothetical protein